MWTNESIEQAVIRAQLCESVTLTRDSYLELLDTARYEQATRDALRSIIEADTAWFEAPIHRLVESAGAHADRMNEARKLLGIEPVDYDPPKEPTQIYYARDDQ
jgi:hypothetical protein